MSIPKHQTDLTDALAELLRGIRPEFDFTSSSEFIEDGMLDSYDVVSLVATLDQRYGISIEGVDILPEHFRSLDTIASLLRRYDIRP